MKPRRFLAVAVLLVAIFVAGCGGDDGGSTVAAPVETTTTPSGLTKEELVAQGNAICAEVNAAVGTVSSTGADSAGQVSQEASLYTGMVERLEDLGEPTDDSTGYAEFISAAQELAQAQNDANLAAERGEEATLATAQGEASSALSSFQTAASSFGLEKCAEAPSAPVPGTGGVAGVEEPSEEASEVTEEEAAPEEAEPAPEEAGGAAPGGETGGGTESGGGGSSSGGIGPG